MWHLFVKSNHLKEVSYFTQSVSISERANSEVFGNPYYDGLTENNKTINGALTGITQAESTTGTIIADSAE